MHSLQWNVLTVEGRVYKVVQWLDHTGHSRSQLIDVYQVTTPEPITGLQISPRVSVYILLFMICKDLSEMFIGRILFVVFKDLLSEIFMGRIFFFSNLFKYNIQKEPFNVLQIYFRASCLLGTPCAHSTTSSLIFVWLLSMISDLLKCIPERWKLFLSFPLRIFNMVAL